MLEVLPVDMGSFASRFWASLAARSQSAEFLLGEVSFGCLEQQAHGEDMFTKRLPSIILVLSKLRAMVNFSVPT